MAARSLIPPREQPDHADRAIPFRAGRLPMKPQAEELATFEKHFSDGYHPEKASSTSFP